MRSACAVIRQRYIGIMRGVPCDQRCKCKEFKLEDKQRSPFEENFPTLAARALEEKKRMVSVGAAGAGRPYQTLITPASAKITRGTSGAASASGQTSTASVPMPSSDRQQSAVLRLEVSG